MILTGKAKEDFEKWFSDYSEKNHHLSGWRDYDQYIDEVELPETLQYAIIQEWFDSVGIYISPYTNGIVYEPGVLWYYSLVTENYRSTYHLSRNEAVEAAITNANLIYNERQ